MNNTPPNKPDSDQAMQTNAPLNPTPFLLLLGFSLLFACPCTGFASWCFYDGAVAYPQQRERALAYQELEQAGRADEWEEAAAQKGWPTQEPGEPYSELSITTQYIMGGFTGGLALLLLLAALASLIMLIRASAQQSPNPRA